MRALVGWSRPQADIDAAWSIVDQGLIRQVDRIDNGEVEPQIDSLASLLDDLNADWKADAVSGRDTEMDAFQEAVRIVDGLFRPHLRAAFREVDAERVVLTAVQQAEDPRVIVLDGYTPWHETVHRHALPVLYALYPRDSGNWMIGCMPSAPRRFDQKRPLPEAWAGLRDGDLAALSGVPDAAFYHLNRFVAAARSREGALAMARLALQ